MELCYTLIILLFVRSRKVALFWFGKQKRYSNSVDKKWWEFDVSCFGHRAIMNDVTAAMGLEQLKKLSIYMEKRKQCTIIIMLT